MRQNQLPTSSATTQNSSNGRKIVLAALVMASEAIPTNDPGEKSNRATAIRLYTEALLLYPPLMVKEAIANGLLVWKFYPRLAEIVEQIDAIKAKAPPAEPFKFSWQEKQMAGWDHAEIERTLRTSDLARRAKAEGWLHGLGAFIGDHHRHPAAQEIPAIIRSQREATEAAAARASVSSVNATPLGATLLRMADVIWRGMKGQEEKWSALIN